MRERRVVVTGLGAISALGASVDETWRNAKAGVCGISTHTLDPGESGPEPHTLPLARVAAGYERSIVAGLGPRVLAGMDPFAAFALAASHEALADAGLLGSPALDTRTAIVLGHGMGGLTSLESGYERFYGKKLARLHPTMVPRVMVSSAVSAVAMTFGVHGVVFATSSACASSAHAIAQASAMITAGLADVAIVGGSEAISTPGCMRAWQAIHALSETTCKPFAKDRDGMVMGEGAGVLVIEALEHARARGARVHGELVGAGMTSDAFHITQPSLAGPTAAMRQACAAAKLAPGANVLISAHGTGTSLNDSNEAAAIREVFGERTANCPVIATKSGHGHLIGGSASLQAVIALRALAEGLAPAIVNTLEPDPVCAVDLVLGAARPIAASHLLVNAFAFGGLNASLLFASANAMDGAP